jgi:hypothetical protein
MADRSRMAVALVALSLVACSDKEPGVAQAQTSVAAHHDAPKVGYPIDVTPFLGRPCSALRPDHLRQLNVPVAGTADADAARPGSQVDYVGPSCFWRNSEQLVSVGVAFVTKNDHGLADIYRAHDQGQFSGYWIETTVDGYPGVFTSATDDRKDGNCSLDVAISDTVTFLITRHEFRGGEKTCDTAKVAASLVLQTIRAGG